MVQDETQTTCISQPSLPEPDEVYYKFGGAAIAEMLEKRYRSIHSCPENKRGTIVVEITVLKAMECLDKSIIPPSLQYRDNGFIYFPDEALSSRQWMTKSSKLPTRRSTGAWKKSCSSDN